MNGFVTVLLAVIVFGVLIFVHELGHFLAAKAVGVRVNEFALGMGPVLFKIKKGETQYAIRLFPIGGFVSMEGEDPTAEDVKRLDESNDSGAFYKKKVWQRIIIVTAGAAMNILLGFLIMVGITSSDELLSTTVVARFDEGAVSNSVLRENDEILKVNGTKIHIANDIIFTMLRDDDGYVDMTVIRDGKETELSQIPFEVVTYEDGMKAMNIDFKVYGVEKSFWGVIRESWYMTASVVRSVWTSLIDLVTGKYGMSQLSGPVGTASAISQASSMGLRSLLMMVVMITVNLGVFNLLPLPALDGGRLLFLLIEAIRRKPIKPQYEGYVHMVGFLLLMGLMLVVTFNDILKLF